MPFGLFEYFDISCRISGANITRKDNLTSAINWGHWLPTWPFTCNTWMGFLIFGYGVYIGWISSRIFNSLDNALGYMTPSNAEWGTKQQIGSI